MPATLSIARGATAAVGVAAMLACPQSSSAVSPEAQMSRKATDQIIEATEASRFLFGPKARLIEELHTLLHQCSRPDWDGYGARPMDALAFARAVNVVRLLPTSLPLPECAPEPDGSVSLDWIVSPQKVFSVSIGRSQRVSYAWIDGGDSGNGVSALDGDSLPERVLLNILETIGEHHATLGVA